MDEDCEKTKHYPLIIHPTLRKRLSKGIVFNYSNQFYDDLIAMFKSAILNEVRKV